MSLFKQSDCKRFGHPIFTFESYFGCIKDIIFLGDQKFNFVFLRQCSYTQMLYVVGKYRRLKNVYFPGIDCIK